MIEAIDRVDRFLAENSPPLICRSAWGPARENPTKISRSRQRGCKLFPTKPVSAGVGGPCMSVSNAVSPLDLSLFGPFAARIGDAPLESLTHRQMALLALLALHADDLVSKEWVVEQLWPAEGRTIGLLNKLLQEVEEALAPAGIKLSPVPGKLRLDSAAITVDAIAFSRAWARREAEPSALVRAIELFRGPLLEDWEKWWDDRDWVKQARARYSDQRREALVWLAGHAAREGAFEAAIGYARSLTQSGELAEQLHGRLMDALMAAEQYVVASQFYEEYRDLVLRPRRLLPPRRMSEQYERIPRAAVLMGDTSVPGLVEEEPIGGAMRLDSHYYVVRPCDRVIHSAVKRRDCIVRIQGPRQTGKTSLLARVLEQARQDGALVLASDFQALGPQDTENIERFFMALASQFHRTTKTSAEPGDYWDPRLSANANFEGYLRDVVLQGLKQPVVWGIDEADRIFDREYRSSVFGLFRSWHNRRSLEPDEAWNRFTLIMAYSAEARMLIPNPNESPFNVGTGTTLQDFTKEQVADLNERYGSPLAGEPEIDRLLAAFGGHPFLVRTCLYEMKTRPARFEEIASEGIRDDSLFAEHLDRIYRTVVRAPERERMVSDLLRGQPCSDLDTFSRLRSAGVLAGDSMREARVRCGLYAEYLKGRLL